MCANRIAQNGSDLAIDSQGTFGDCEMCANRIAQNGSDLAIDSQGTFGDCEIKKILEAICYEITQ